MNYRMLVVALGAAIVGVASAQTYSTGFEGPTFGPGTVAGQDGWVLGTTGTNVGTIVTAPVLTGQQALQIGQQGGIAARDFGSTSLAGKILTIGADVRIGTESAAIDSTDFGIGIYTPTSLTVGQLFAGARLSAADQTVILSGKLTSNGALFTSTSAQTINLGTWYRLELVVDYTKAANNVSVRFGQSGGALNTLGITQTVDTSVFPNFRYAGTTINFAGASSGAYDNFSVQAVPEPGTMAALGLGAMALIRRRRNRA